MVFLMLLNLFLSSTTFIWSGRFDLGDISKKNRSIDVRRTMQNHFFYKSRLPTPKKANLPDQIKVVELKNKLSNIKKTINNKLADMHPHYRLRYCEKATRFAKKNLSFIFDVYSVTSDLHGRFFFFLAFSHYINFTAFRLPNMSPVKVVFFFFHMGTFWISVFMK
jgi:hypothetical protein